jgi:hypothetical protein
MVSKRKDLHAPRVRVAPRTPGVGSPIEGDIEAQGSEEVEDELDDDRPRAHRRSGGGGGFGPAIAGIMQGIDADIFRDPAAIQRMQRDSNAVVRTADGTVIGIELPGEGVIEGLDPEPEEEPAG